MGVVKTERPSGWPEGHLQDWWGVVRLLNLSTNDPRLPGDETAAQENWQSRYVTTFSVGLGGRKESEAIYVKDPEAENGFALAGVLYIAPKKYDDGLRCVRIELIQGDSTGDGWVADRVWLVERPEDLEKLPLSVYAQHDRVAVLGEEIVLEVEGVRVRGHVDSYYQDDENHVATICFNFAVWTEKQISTYHHNG